MNSSALDGAEENIRLLLTKNPSVFQGRGDSFEQILQLWQMMNARCYFASDGKYPNRLIHARYSVIEVFDNDQVIDWLNSYCR